eukprot:10191505-Alexandrium_andersonii.AAC.1
MGVGGFAGQARAQLLQQAGGSGGLPLAAQPQHGPGAGPRGPGAVRRLHSDAAGGDHALLDHERGVAAL